MKMISMLEAEYNKCGEKQKMMILDIIEAGSQHEYHFWDAAYHHQTELELVSCQPSLQK